jgi:hypothetical protein
VTLTSCWREELVVVSSAIATICGGSGKCEGPTRQRRPYLFLSNLNGITAIMAGLPHVPDGDRDKTRAGINLRALANRLGVQLWHHVDAYGRRPVRGAPKFCFAGAHKRSFGASIPADCAVRL